MAIKVSGTEVISDDKRILNNEDLPDIRPSLLLDFANSKTLDPRITFTRGSTATYWDGKTTAKAEENLLTYSQDYTQSDWLKAGTSATGDSTTAPDGTTTADTITITSEGNYRGIKVDVSAFASTDYTASVYVKKSSHDYVRFYFSSFNSGSYLNSPAKRDVNLTNGATIGSDIGTCTTTDVGNGWYRITVSGTTHSSANEIRFEVNFVDSSGSPTPTPSVANGQAIFVWGAQLEQRSSATAYTATTSSPIVKYQPVLQTAASGEARFDHDPVTGESKGLLIEEARTNVYTYSVLSNANWDIVRSTLSEDSTIAPDGTLTAARLVSDTQTSTQYAKINVNIPTTATYTLSFYVKAAERDEVGVWFGGADQSPQSRVHFNLSNETMSLFSGAADVAYGMEAVGNGWYRVWLSDEVDASTGFAPIVVLTDGNDYNITGDGYSGIHVWGAQLEEGSFPTSYIPTSGSTVTRAKDDARVFAAQFSPLYNPVEGTMFAEFSSTSDDAAYSRIWDVGSSSTNDNRFTMFHVPRSSSRHITVEYRTDNSTVASLPPILATDVVTDAKVAATWAQDDFAVSGNGNAVLTDTSGSIQSSIPRDALGIGGDPDGGSALTGTIKKLAYYPKRLPNATLQAMTEA